MLRLPKFALARPTTVAQALALLAEHGERAMVMAGGTDLVPNMKHGLFTPEVVVSLAGVAELRGIARDERGWLRIGATTAIEAVAASELARERAPCLAQAAGLIAGPQLRSMGTLGGNVMLDTRCQWYNQTHFWRSALGYCLKKDGSVCHVVDKGRKCVAAASNDTAPALMTLGAVLEIAGPDAPGGRREVAIDDFWTSDGIHNNRLGRGELLLAVRIPPTGPGHRGAYGKLRERGSIDFPMLGVAARLELDAQGAVADADLVLTALAARPKRVANAAETLRGTIPGQPAFAEAVADLADLAHRQCKPLANIPGDDAYRHAMVPVYVRRTLLAAAERRGPVHHV
jgi:4-hydroxybenzoyl-CoA reductase subunit beta